MIYTLAKLRTYARSVDERLANVTTYPDTWIDERIEEGMALTNDIKPVFYTKETYNMASDVALKMSDIEIILQKEPHSVVAIEGDMTFFDITMTPNNHVIVNPKYGNSPPADMTVTVRYFFYPTLPFTEIEMTMEMYRFCKSGIAATIFGWLSDKESEQYHTAKAESMIVKSTFDLEKDLLSIPDGRLWSGTWA